MVGTDSRLIRSSQLQAFAESNAGAFVTQYEILVSTMSVY